jgi:hypothetical protein
MTSCYLNQTDVARPGFRIRVSHHPKNSRIRKSSNNQTYAFIFQSLVKPRCGRLVGFSAGSENSHGVLSVQRGRRCALGLWFTLNPFYEEIEHILAKQVLLQVQQGGSITDQLLHELEKHVYVGSSTSHHKPTSAAIKEQLNLQDNYVKKSQSPDWGLLDCATR